MRISCCRPGSAAAAGTPRPQRPWAHTGRIDGQPRRPSLIARGGWVARGRGDAPCTVRQPFRNTPSKGSPDTPPVAIPEAQRGHPAAGTPAHASATDAAGAIGDATSHGPVRGRSGLLALHREARGLCALQLAARGYSAEQVAALRGVAAAEVARDLRGAVRALGAASVGEAIDAAARRGLLL